MLAGKIKMPHLCMEKQVCNARNDIRQSDVRDDSNLLDPLDMVPEEFEVRRYVGKVLEVARRI